MKLSNILILVLIISATARVSAQDATDEFTFGIKAGLNYSNVWDDEGEDFKADPKTGFAAGIFLGIPIGSVIGFQPELLISQKGFKGSGTILGTPYSFSRTTTFIDVPLLLQLKPSPIFSILLGPQYSYLMNQKDVYTLGSNSIEQEQEFENDEIRKNILGFTLGADININQVVISGRMGWDLQKNHGDGSSSTPRYKNQWLQLTAGLKF
ncbi:MAG: porin family protein [Flavobacteriales bacterium]|nr:porin family protein [Flavobacteriales bacterium]